MKHEYFGKQDNLNNSLFVFIPTTLPLYHTADFVNQTYATLKKRKMIVGVIDCAEVSFSRSNAMQSNSSNKIRGLLPFNRFLVIKRINILIHLFYLVLSKKNQKKIIWIFEPTLWYLSLLKFFPNTQVIYDCVDYHSSLNSTYRENTKKSELLLLRLASHTFVNSSTLYDIHKKTTQNISIVPQGFDQKIFKNKQKKINYVKFKKKSNIGFIGGINDRIDFSLLCALEKMNISIVLAGPVQKDNFHNKEKIALFKKLLQSKNVTYFGPLPKRDMPFILESISVGIIPYDISLDFNLYCYPMKIFEYFYAGIPVVSTKILELQSTKFEELIYTCDKHSDWQNIISSLSSKRWPKYKKMKQLEESLQNTWDNKISKILEKTAGSFPY